MSVRKREFIAENRVASYIRTWNIPSELQQGNPYWNSDMVKAEYLTDLIIAFALIDRTDGSSIYIPQLRSRPQFSLWDEIAALKLKHPHLRVNLSVGGWGAEGFSDMTFNASLRSAFVSNVCDWLERYDLDGVDIDWEYPVGPAWGQEIKSRPQDRRNWIALLKDLRNALNRLETEIGKRYSLSACIPASEWFVSVNDTAAAAEIVDALKLMAYDYYGSWSSTTGHHSNLYNNPDDPYNGGWSTDQALNAFLAANVPPEKIMLGFGFYGRAFGGVAPGPGGNGLYQPFGWLPFEFGSISWDQLKELLKPDSGYTRYWDEKAKAPFLYNGDTWISYTDEEQIKLLCDYAKSKNLGGVFTWEYIHDIDAELLQILYENSR